MTEKKTVVVGTIGAGYAADLHASGYQRVCGVNVRLKTICDVRLEAAEQIKERYGYEHAASDYEDLLRDPEIDVIDLVTQPDVYKRQAAECIQ